LYPSISLYEKYKEEDEKKKKKRKEKQKALSRAYGRSAFCFLLSFFARTRTRKTIRHEKSWIEKKLLFNPQKCPYSGKTIS